MRIHIPALLAALLAGALASPAAAQIEIAWDDCGLAGNLLKTWTCDSNPTEVGRFHVSFHSEPGLTAVTGAQTVIDLWTPVAVPPWWQMVKTGSCRPGGYGMAVAFNTPCASASDYFNTVGTPLGGFGYDWGAPNFAPQGGRIRTVQAISIDAAGPIGPGEYYLLTVILKGLNTVGPGSCSGCLQPMGLLLNSVLLTQPVGVGDHLLVISDQPVITWQCPGSLGGECWPGPYCTPPVVFSCATPAHAKSWGQIKTLYR